MNPDNYRNYICKAKKCQILKVIAPSDHSDVKIVEITQSSGSCLTVLKETDMRTIVCILSQHNTTIFMIKCQNQNNAESF